MFKDLPEGQTHWERYGVIPSGAKAQVYYVLCEGVEYCTTYNDEHGERARTIARALNAYAALEQVKSIGEANKEKENE